MNKVLMVPVRVDALYLTKSKAAAEPTANFRGLPYYDSVEGRDVNSDTPWIGDFATSPPFENSNMLLQAGVHLHWSIPDGLCHGEVVEGEIEMPSVPNRWLIRRRQAGNADAKSWVVESDYLWPPTDHAPAVNIFHRSANTEIPYRFLGRKLTLEEWEKKNVSTTTDEYLEKLTAIGHGEPSFAAYYPNCSSVFGFHDPQPPDDWTDVQYDLIGWYGDDAIFPPLSWEPGAPSEPSLVERNLLETALGALQTELSANSSGVKLPDISQLIAKGWLAEQAPPNDYLLLGGLDDRQPLDITEIEPPIDALLLRLSLCLVEPLRRWRGDQGPQQILCYSSIKLTRGDPVGATATDEFKIAVGNTVSEALCAQLANEVADQFDDPELSNQIEEQLEALNIEGELSASTLDLGLRLRHYRHRKSFDPMSGSERWTVHSDQPGTGLLPDNILSALRHLNEVQARYGRQQSELTNARRQLYGDWCSYMRCVYRPPDGGTNEFLDIDEVVAYIENRTLERVERLSNIVEITGDGLKASKGDVDALIRKLNLGAVQVMETESHNNPGAPESPVQYELCSVPGTRYWAPTDPVVLVSGGSIRLNERHGHDARHAADANLLCETYETELELEAELSDGDRREKLFRWMDAQWSPDSCIGFREVNVTQLPWNPLFLDWGIDMHPAESHLPDKPGSYDGDIITGNYLLGTQNPDLQPDILWTHDDPDRFSSRCILGSTASLVLKERIEDVLRRRLLDGKPESWARSDAENEAEVTYFGKMSDWYKDTRKPSDLPTTPAELKSLVDWYMGRHLRTGKSWDTIEFANAKPADQARDPIYCTLLAYRKLFDNANATGEAAKEKLRPRAFLGQALSGFNEELIQWKLGLTLPIEEPVGLDPYRKFTERVAKAVGDETAWMTEPTNNFSPIRSGALKLDKLRLLDSFGQVADVPCDEQVIVPAPYRVPGRPGVAFLPPRLAQPALVSFRWLDSHPDQPGEMVEAAARSPICGWLVPEKLSGRLLVFDGDGTPLGALAADRDNGNLEWVRAPGLPRLSEAECHDGLQLLQLVSSRYSTSAETAEPDTNEEHVNAQLRDLGELGACIKNRRLARVLLYLWATRSPEFLESFINTLEDAMAGIDPEGATSMGSTVLLVGRPVAVVGAELNLELKDEPSVRQDWAAFVLDQNRHRRDTDQFDQVRFPMRLGEYNSRNDGILGYWLEENGGFIDDSFVAQAADDDDRSRPLKYSKKLPGFERTAKINAHDQTGQRADAINFTQSIADGPLQTTLLMDPRGRAHLTSGILPVKSIDIPRSLWEPALEAIRVWFPVAPILSRHGSRRVPTPTLVDRHWSWLEPAKTNEEQGWQTLGSRPSVSQSTLQNTLAEFDDILNSVSHPEMDQLIAKGWMQNADLPGTLHLIEQGWLEEQGPTGDRLFICEREERQPLNNRALEAPMDALLARLSLALVSPGDEPDFNPGVEVREGWLLLEPGNGAKKR